MSMPATFYTEIGFATKLNYLAYIEKYPREAKELQEIIDRHYSQMKKECIRFTQNHHTAIYLVEERRKEETRRAKVEADQAKLQLQKEQWAAEINNDSLAGLTQKAPIVDLTEPDITSQMEQLKIGFQAQVSELRGYIVFLESKCTQLGQENFELEKVNYKLSEENKKLKHQLNDQLTDPKRKRSQ